MKGEGHKQTRRPLNRNVFQPKFRQQNLHGLSDMQARIHLPLHLLPLSSGALVLLFQFA